MEWVILDCGGAFPLCGEVMESRLDLHICTTDQLVR